MRPAWRLRQAGISGKSDHVAGPERSAYCRKDGLVGALPAPDHPLFSALLGVLARSLPDGVAVGRGDIGGTCPGGPLGHRYAVALGLALAAP